MLRTDRTEHDDDGQVTLPFLNRQQAGQLLAPYVQRLHLDNPLVLALPRGGIPVAVEIASLLKVPLDLLLVRKIGTPEQPELALAAVVEGSPPQVIINEPVQAIVRVSDQWLKKATDLELAEIARRRKAYLHNSTTLPLQGREVVVVDDGIATGTTMRAALAALRLNDVARIVLAVPVASPDVAHQLKQEVDELICLAQPTPFEAIGLHYQDFHQLPDDEVKSLLADFTSPHRMAPKAKTN